MPPVRMLGLLMLMFFRCAGADSACPADLLTLDPPEVVEEYDKSVSVNCTSSEEYYEDMFLIFGNTEHSADGDQTIERPLSLSDWNITAECRIKLNDTFECSRDLKITMYKNPAEVIMLPINNGTPVVEGRPYQLRCDVRDVAPAQNLSVTWYKNNQTYSTQSFNDRTEETPGDLSATLEVNFNRRDDGAQFRCEAQLDFGSKPPVISDMHEISVDYAPELKNNEAPKAVREGDTCTLKCEAEGNPPPVYKWTSDGMDIPESTSSLDITVNKSATYICTASNYLGSKTMQIYVRMLPRPRAAPPVAVTTPKALAPRVCPLTLTPDEVVVRFGDKVSIFCNTSETNVSGMGWEATSGGIPFTAGVTSLPWTVEKLEQWVVETVCYVTLNDGHQCNIAPSITLYKTPDTVSVSATHREMVEGGEYLLDCDITNVAPVQNLTVKWYRGDEVVNTHIVSDTNKTPDSVSSPWRITAERADNGAPFRCEAELRLGPKGAELVLNATSSPYTAVVLYEPLIQNCPERYTGLEHKFSLDTLPCHADANPATTLQWYYQDQPIDASLTLDRAHTGKFTVKAENHLGSSNASVDITVEYRPSFTCTGSYNVEEGAEPQTLCEPEGVPKPKVTWYKDDKSEVTLQRLERTDSGEYLLLASNRHGEARHMLNLTVLYAPEFMEGNHTKEVAPGGNVTFGCRAEGNPVPAIHWNFSSAVNVKATTWGRQGSITVTGATSTNAGVYICVATNEIGSVTRSVTLVMKGKTSGFPTWLIWALLIALIICAVLILTVIYHNRYKKHGQYSFVPDKAKDIALTPISDGVQA